MKNLNNLNINSKEFKDFKRFILELKKLNSEYIEFKCDNKTYLGKPKKFEEFISECIDKLNESQYVRSDSEALRSTFSPNLTPELNLSQSQFEPQKFSGISQPLHRLDSFSQTRAQKIDASSQFQSNPSLKRINSRANFDFEMYMKDVEDFQDKLAKLVLNLRRKHGWSER